MRLAPLIALAALADTGDAAAFLPRSLTPRVRAAGALSGLVPRQVEPAPVAKPLTPLAIGGRALGSAGAIVVSGWLPSLAPLGAKVALAEEVTDSLSSLPWEVIPAAIVLSFSAVAVSGFGDRRTHARRLARPRSMPVLRNAASRTPCAVCTLCVV